MNHLENPSERNYNIIDQIYGLEMRIWFVPHGAGCCYTQVFWNIKQDRGRTEQKRTRLIGLKSEESGFVVKRTIRTRRFLL